jgi:bifunctional non-homologous end joining protein LigD
MQLKIVSMPRLIKPQLATLVDRPPIGNEWLHEIKFDGYRILCFIKGKNITLLTRNQKDWTHKFPTLVHWIARLKCKDAILDGELVALDSHQRSNFQLLQNALHESDTRDLIYYVFDLLYYNGLNLTEFSLKDRKQLLKKLIPADSKLVRYSKHVVGHGQEFFEKTAQLGLEGVVSKKQSGIYLQKRTRQWLKSKHNQRQEFIVVGFTEPTGHRNYFGSLLLAVYTNNQKLKYCGRVGTGFTERSLKQIHRLLRRYQISQPIFPKTQFRKITWVEPKIIVEVEFTQWTQGGALRHPSFKGVRYDKKPKQVVREKPTIRRRKIN